MKWIEQGTCNQRPGEQLVAIEQDGFGIVCAVLDYEGESVYRILRAVNAYDDLLAACKAVAAALDRIQQDGSIVWLGEGPVHESASERLAWVIAKAEGKSDA